jgi:hypothetical protein
VAIDTEGKRRSVHGYTGIPIFPVADGTIAALDRQHVVGIYAGIAAAILTPIIETIAFTLKIAEQVAFTLGISEQVSKTLKIAIEKKFDLDLL